MIMIWFQEGFVHNCNTLLRTASPAMHWSMSRTLRFVHCQLKGESAEHERLPYVGLVGHEGSNFCLSF